MLMERKEVENSVKSLNEFAQNIIRESKAHHEFKKVNKKEKVVKEKKEKTEKTEDKEPKENCLTLMKEFSKIVNLRLNLPPCLWGKKELALTKKLIDHYGFDMTKKVFIWTVNNWTMIKRKFKFDGVPTVSIIFGYRSYLFTEIEKERKEKILNSKEDEF